MTHNRVVSTGTYSISSNDRNDKLLLQFNTYSPNNQEINPPSKSDIQLHMKSKTYKVSAYDSQDNQMQKLGQGRFYSSMWSM